MISVLHIASSEFVLCASRRTGQRNAVRVVLWMTWPESARKRQTPVLHLDASI